MSTQKGLSGLQIGLIITGVVVVAGGIGYVLINKYQTEKQEAILLEQQQKQKRVDGLVNIGKNIVDVVAKNRMGNGGLASLF